MTTEEKITELINIRDNFNYTLAPREVFDDAIKALKRLDKIVKACDIYEKQGDNYYGYIKICVAKDIAENRIAPLKSFHLMSASPFLGELYEIRNEMNILDDKGEFNILGALAIIDKHIKEIEE